MRMTKIKKMAVLVAVLTATLLIPFSQNYAAEKYLKRYIYPFENDEGYFKYGSNMALLGNTLFVLENPKHHLLKFQFKNKKIAYLETVGRPGVGPGELNLPADFIIWNNIIAIKDESGISFFDINGKFLSKFRLFTPHISLGYINDKIFYVTCTPGNPNLIQIFKKNGESVKSFLKKFLVIDFKKQSKKNPFSAETYFYEGKILNDEKYVYFFSTKFGKVFKFDQNGNEIPVKKDILPYFGEKGSWIVEKNKKMIENGIEVIKGMNPVYGLFKDVCIFKNKIYILGFDIRTPDMEIRKMHKDLFILVLDKETLNLEKTFWINLGEEEFLQAFSVGERNGKPAFFSIIYGEEELNIIEFYE